MSKKRKIYRRPNYLDLEIFKKLDAMIDKDADQEEYFKAIMISMTNILSYALKNRYNREFSALTWSSDWLEIYQILDRTLHKEMKDFLDFVNM
ncbi:MAG: hypothetical protein FWC41_00050 [Firmicutes bacterium]|nr:hypothetical protein [Bacillota bacterium]